MRIINSNIIVKKYETRFNNDFFVLNKSWIEESWILEESDKKDLMNPKHIVDMGGQVFFAIDNQITICLLYTSPSPRDSFRSRMPSSA